MRHLLLLVLGLLLIGSVATAAELFTVTGPTHQGVIPPTRSLVTFTQNLNPTILEPGQVACGVAGVSTTQNWYLRRFLLNADHGIVGGLLVQSIDMGVEQLQMADLSTPPPYDIAMKIFSIGHSSAFLFANMTQVGEGTATITDALVGAFLNVPVTSDVIADPVAQDLVVAIDAPDGAGIGAGLQFRPGCNGQGVIADSYLAANDCSVPEPITVTSIGFPTSQTIFVVNGDENPVPVENTSWGAVKALYR